MTRIKQIIILTLTFSLTSCGSRTDKKNFQHNYKKYWDKYSDQQLKDTLFADTLVVGPDTEGSRSSREFYINTTNQLLTDLKDDKNQIDSLYPMTSFDEVTFKNLPLGIVRTLTDKQTERFLEIITNPVSFNWAETTYEPQVQVDFLENHQVVASLTIGSDKSIIKPNPDWPAFKKMKFGRLKLEAYNNLAKLIDEID